MRNYYLEDQINDMFSYLNIGHKDANLMTEEELKNSCIFLSYYFDWVNVSDYYQAVPKNKETGVILPVIQTKRKKKQDISYIQTESQTFQE